MLSFDFFSQVINYLVKQVFLGTPTRPPKKCAERQNTKQLSAELITPTKRFITQRIKRTKYQHTKY